MMTANNKKLCAKALEQCMERGENVLAFICIQDDDLHAYWCGIDDEQTSYLERRYAESIIYGPGVETIARYKTIK